MPKLFQICKVIIIIKNGQNCNIASLSTYSQIQTHYGDMTRLTILFESNTIRKQIKYFLQLWPQHKFDKIQEIE